MATPCPNGCWAAIGWCVLALAVANAGRGATPDTDWPQWRGPRRNDISAESSGWPRGWPPKKLWETQLGYGCTSPVLAGGKLYVMGWQGDRRGMGTDTVYCLDARTGRTLWKQTYPCRYQGRVRTGDLAAYGGPSSTPALDRSTGWLYTLSIDGHVHCWDAAQQGRLVWKKGLYDVYEPRQRPDVGKGTRDHGYPTSPLLLGDLLLIEVNAAEGTVMAFDKRTGEQRWASQYTGLAGHTGGMSPMRVGDMGCLAVLTLRNLVVMRLDKGHEGETVATAPWTTDFACNIATPAVAGSRVLVTSGYNHEESRLFEITPKAARAVWTTRAYAKVSSPVIYRDRVFLVDGKLQCVDLKTGKLRWSGGSYGHGSCLVTAADHKVIVFGSRKVAVVEALPDKDEYRELARLDGVVRATCYPHVTLSNGVLVCKDRNGAMAVFSVRPVPDTTPPEVVSATATGDPTKLRVSFSEPIDPATARGLGNYAIDYGVKIAAVALSQDGTSATLTVSPLREGAAYTLTVKGLRDRADKPNALEADARLKFRFTPTRRVVDGLIALYGFEEGKGTTVADLSGAGKPLNLTIRDPGSVKWLEGGLSVTKPTIIESAGPATKLVEACRKSGEATLEAWLKPANTSQAGPARIVSLSKDPYARNFTLGQERARYDVRFRTTKAGENGMTPSLGGGTVATALTHVVYTRDRSGSARLYVNGAQQSQKNVGGDLSNWDGSQRFGLANELTRDRPWLGELHLVALYARALTADEVAMNHRAGPEGGHQPK